MVMMEVYTRTVIKGNSNILKKICVTINPLFSQTSRESAIVNVPNS